MLKTTLPEGTELWGVRVSGENETARTEVEDGVTFHNIPLPGTSISTSPSTFASRWPSL